MSKLEEYKVFIEHIDNITDRRPTITTTYISVNTAIVGIIALVVANSGLVVWAQQLAVLVLLIAGVIACDFWRKLISQYKILLEWWYQQLRDLEQKVPDLEGLITKEYNELYVDGLSNKLGMTQYEIYLTWLYTILYFVFAILVIIIFILR